VTEDREWIDKKDPRFLICMLMADHLTSGPAVSPDEDKVLAETLGALRQVEMIRQSGDVSIEAITRVSRTIVEGFEQRIEHLRACVEPA
jgi:hypothetical protein